MQISNFNKQKPNFGARIDANEGARIYPEFLPPYFFIKILDVEKQEGILLMFQSHGDTAVE